MSKKHYKAYIIGREAGIRAMKEHIATLLEEEA